MREFEGLLSEGVVRLTRNAALRQTLSELFWDGTLIRCYAIQKRIANKSMDATARAKLFFGEWMTVDLREPISQQLFLAGSYEEGLSRFLFLVLKEHMTFFDVGAHLGYFSLLARHKVGPDGLVVAFEPTPHTQERLIQNTAPYSNIEVEPLAAWSTSADLTLNDYGRDWSNFNSIGPMRMPAAYATKAAGVFDVAAVALDDYCSKRSLIPDIVKIDAESSEPQVLEGMRELLSSARPIVTVEVGDFPHIPPTRDMLRYLEAQGYLLFEPRLEGLSRHEVKTCEGYPPGNLVGIPEDRITELERSLFVPS
jgi:FkbM family methyltransferase